MCSCFWYVEVLFRIIRLAWNRLCCADPESAETKLDPRVSGISKLATKTSLFFVVNNVFSVSVENTALQPVNR